jgi:hypothetical protein
MKTSFQCSENKKSPAEQDIFILRRDRINFVDPNRGVRQAKNVPIASRLLLFLIFIAYKNKFLML